MLPAAAPRTFPPSLPRFIGMLGTEGKSCGINLKVALAGASSDAIALLTLRVYLLKSSEPL
jgi:hypothetical protein